MTTDQQQHNHAKGRRYRARRTALVVTLLAVILSSLVAYKYFTREAKPIPLKVHPPTVTVETVAAVDYPVTIRTRGTVHPIHDVLLVAQVSGTVERIQLEPGTVVSKLSESETKRIAENQDKQFQGLTAYSQLSPEEQRAFDQTIFSTLEKETLSLLDRKAVALINPQDYHYAVEEAWIGLYAANKDYGRNERLYRQRGNDGNPFISERELDRSAVQLALGKVRWKSEWTHLRRTRIVSPMNGVVAERFVDQGDHVSINEKVARIVDLHRVKVVVGLTSEEIIRLRASLKKDTHYPLSESAMDHALAQLAAGTAPKPVVTVRVLGLDRLYRGLVVSVGNAAGASTGTYSVEVVLDNPDGVLLAGMSAYDVQLVVDTRSRVTIPRQSIFYDLSGSPFVYLLNSINAVRQEIAVDTHFEDDARVSIRSGLKPGARLIVPIERTLVDGQPVTLQQKSITQDRVANEPPP